MKICVQLEVIYNSKFIQMLSYLIKFDGNYIKSYNTKATCNTLKIKLENIDFQVCQFIYSYIY